jgi:hypothetical protein
MTKLKTTWLLAGALALSAAACGDDDDGADADAAPGDNVDAMPEVELLRSGTIAIAQNTVTDVETVGNLNGGSVAAGYIDRTTITVAPLPGFDSDPPLGSCLITVYDTLGGDVEPTATDEGTLTVTGTNHGPFSCNNTDGVYRCQSADPAVATKVATGAAAASIGPPGTPIQLTFPPDSFPEDGLAGMFVVANDFANGGTPASFNGVALPVVGQTDTSVVRVANPVFFTGVAMGGDDASVNTFIGAGPVPGGFTLFDEGDTITLAKAESDLVAAFEVTTAATGVGFALDTASAQPHEFGYGDCDPATEDCGMSFTCADDGVCGENVGEPGQLNLLTISGEANDGDLDALGLSPYAMPSVFDTKVTFQCSAIGTANGITVSEEAIAAILGTGPTRVRLSVGRFTGTIVSQENRVGTTNVLVGSLLTGFTDILQ